MFYERGQRLYHMAYSHEAEVQFWIQPETQNKNKSKYIFYKKNRLSKQADKINFLLSLVVCDPILILFSNIYHKCPKFKIKANKLKYLYFLGDYSK